MQLGNAYRADHTCKRGAISPARSWPGNLTANACNNALLTSRYSAIVVGISSSTRGNCCSSATSARAELLVWAEASVEDGADEVAELLPALGLGAQSVNTSSVYNARALRRMSIVLQC